MKCPNCGAENPDDAQYCRNCAILLGESSEGSTSSGVSPSSLASLFLTISLILLSIAFVLYAIFYELWVLNHQSAYGATIDEVGRALLYSSGLGDVTAILGLIFIVQVFMTRQPRADLLSRIPRSRLNSIKWMLILTAILLAISLSVQVGLRELNLKLDSGLYLRLAYYPAQFARILATAALLTFGLALKVAEKPNL